MSATKLLVLGVTRLFQPAHGYVVRRELLTWRADEWASVNPGSIYGALRTLTRDGLLQEADTETDGNRPARTTYRLTDDGEAEFFNLVRRYLWREVGCVDLSGLRAALSFLWVVSRDEILSAMDGRASRLEALLDEERFGWEQLSQLDEKPDHIIEHYHLNVELLRGQLAWTRAFAQRVRDGAYAFAGEEDVGAPWHEALAERGLV